MNFYRNGTADNARCHVPDFVHNGSKWPLFQALNMDKPDRKPNDGPVVPNPAKRVDTPPAAPIAAPRDNQANETAEVLAALSASTETTSFSSESERSRRLGKRSRLGPLTFVVLATITVGIAAIAYTLRARGTSGDQASAPKGEVAGAKSLVATTDPDQNLGVIVEGEPAQSSQSANDGDPSKAVGTNPQQDAIAELDDSDDSNSPAPWSLPKPSRSFIDQSRMTASLSPSVAGAASEICAAMAQRDLADAKTRLQAIIVDVPDARDREELHRLKLILTKLEQFWFAVSESTGTLSSGQLIYYRDIEVTVSSVTDNEIVLQAANGQQRKFQTDLQQIEPDLAVALAEHGLRHTGAASLIAIEAFLVMDRASDVFWAHQVWQRAIQQAMPVEVLFPESLFGELAGSSGDATVAGVSALPIVNETRGALPTARIAIPDSGDIDDSIQQIRSAFEKEYEDAAKNDRLLKRLLALKLMQFARETTDNTTNRFALFHEARRVAAEAFEVDLVLQVIDDVALEFDVAIDETRREWLAKLAGSIPRDEPIVKRLIQVIKNRADEAAATDNYELALEYNSIAIQCAVKKRVHIDVRRSLGNRKEKFVAAQQEFERYTNAIDTLKTAPDDPQANLLAGKYLCLGQAKWSEGLVLLTKCGDPELQQLATIEITQPTESGDQKELGDRWLKFTKSSKGSERNTAWLRAKLWYEKALPDLPPLQRKVVEDTLEQGFPEQTASGRAGARVKRLAHKLDEKLQLYRMKKSFYLNRRNRNEKYLRGKVSYHGYPWTGPAWYVIFPDGSFFEWIPPYIHNENIKRPRWAPVDQLTPAYWENPALLFEAPKP